MNALNVKSEKRNLLVKEICEIIINPNSVTNY